MTGQPILINPAGDAERRLWQTTNEITVLLESIRWVLIGGQMLTIIEREHGGGIGRATVDVDALLDVRATVGAPRRAASLLRRAGFDAQPTTDGLAYRFVRDTDIVDLLAPERLGSRADLTTEPPWGSRSPLTSQSHSATRSGKSATTLPVTDPTARACRANRPTDRVGNDHAAIVAAGRDSSHGASASHADKTGGPANTTTCCGVAETRPQHLVSAPVAQRGCVGGTAVPENQAHSF